MKYRELSPNEIEAYNIGYKVGSHKTMITDIEWESDNEYKIYRKGYMAGLMDYRRNVINVSTNNNVSKVNNVNIATSTTMLASKTKDINNNNNIYINNSSNIEPVKKKDINESTTFNAGFQGWMFPMEIRKLAIKYWSSETIREIEKRFSCQEYNTETNIAELLQQYPDDKIKRFIKPTLEQVQMYCCERNNTVDAQKFINYYESNGWKVGKNPMKDWKAAVRTWEKSSFNQQKPKKNWSNYVGEGSFLKPDGEW